MQNISQDYREITADSSKLNFIKAYFEKSMNRTRSEMPKKKAIRPKDLVYNLSQTNSDVNLMKHRVNITKSRMLMDKLSPLKVENSRDVSYYHDSKLNLTFDNIQERLKEELLASIGVKEHSNVFSLPTNLNELKRLLEKSDLLLWTLETYNEMIFNGFSQDFAKSGVLKKPQSLRFGEQAGPTKRKEVEILDNWLCYMLQIVLKQSQSKEEMFENAQIIYTFCLSEIFKQISVQCSERGKLLERVWKAYFSIMINAINVYQTSKISLQKKIETEVKQLKEKYAYDLYKLEKKLVKKNEKIQVLEFNSSELALKLKKSEIKNEQLKHRIVILQSQYSKDKLSLIRLEDDYRNLKELQKMVLEDMDDNVPGYKKVQPKGKIRFRELSKLFLADPLIGNLSEVNLPELPMDAQALIELDKIDLENKVKMHEIQGRIEETAEEMMEKGVDTKDLITYTEMSTVTDLNDFVQSPVNFYLDISPPKDLLILEQVLLGKIKGELWDSEELENYFGSEITEQKKNLELNIDFESQNDVNSEVLQHATSEVQKNRLRNIVRQITSTFIKKNQKKITEIKNTIEDMQEKRIYERHETLRMRKQIFLTYKENVKLKEELEVTKEELNKLITSNKRKKIFKRAVKSSKQKPTVVQEFKLNQKVVLYKKDTVSPAEEIFRRAIEKRKTKVKPNIRSVTLIKLINTLIGDYIQMIKEESMIQAQPLHIFVYDYLSSKHGGLKKVLENKYLQFLLACEMHKRIPFVNLFSRFLGLFDPLTVEYFRSTLAVIELLQKYNKIGVEIMISESDDPLIPTIRCNEVLSSFFSDKYFDTEIIGIKSELAKIAKPCPRCINQSVVEKSEFLLFVIQNYKNYLQLTTNNVKNLFDAADLNKDTFLQFDEFDLLFRCIEPDRYKEDQSKLFFESYSDLTVEKNGESFPAISYEGFTIFALEKDYFRIGAQNLFFGNLDSKEVKGKLQMLHNRCDFVIKEIKWRLEISKRNSKSFEEMIETLRGKLKENDQGIPVYMAYLLIDRDSKYQVVDAEVALFIPSINLSYQVSRVSHNRKRSMNNQMKRQITWKNSMENLEDWEG